MMLDKLLELFGSIPAPLVIAAALLLPAAETALLLGVLVPGELVVVAAGICAARADVPLAGVVVAAVTGAIMGDSIGYAVGRHFRRTVSQHLTTKKWTRAQDWLKNKGKPAIFLARFTAFVRSVMPAVAGAAKVRYRDFMLWNSPAGIIWGAGSALLGYYAAVNAEAVLKWASVAGIVLLIAAIVAVTFFLRRKRLRRRHGRTPRASSA
jgi:membrane protein DedA with SNARE-associated domain